MNCRGRKKRTVALLYKFNLKKENTLYTFVLNIEGRMRKRQLQAEKARCIDIIFVYKLRKWKHKIVNNIYAVVYYQLNAHIWSIVPVATFQVKVSKHRVSLFSHSDFPLIYLCLFKLQFNIFTSVIEEFAASLPFEAKLSILLQMDRR